VAAKTNTEKIDELKDLCNALSNLLNILKIQVQANAEGQEKVEDVLSKVVLQLKEVEIQVKEIGTVKSSLEPMTQLRLDLRAMQKDVEGLARWKEDVKKEKDESARRWWAFAPNISAALTGGLISLLIALLGIAINYYIGKSK
jgi:preprotein translocase subunit SecF